jgi:hypothetical protein
MPEIVMMGKNFMIRCKTCNSEEVNVYDDHIDKVVTEWNQINDPNRRSLLERVRAWFKRKPDSE